MFNFFDFHEKSLWFLHMGLNQGYAIVRLAGGVRLGSELEPLLIYSGSSPSLAFVRPYTEPCDLHDNNSSTSTDNNSSQTTTTVSPIHFASHASQST